MLAIILLNYVDSFEHLGHVITNQLTDNADIHKRRSDFVGESNNVLCFFSNQSSLIKYRLQFTNIVNSYCMSLYGSELWLLSNNQINGLCVSCRKSLRRIWGLPFNFHCYLLPLLSQCLPLLDEICRRSINFIKLCICNGSSFVRAVTNFMTFNAAGIIHYLAITCYFMHTNLTVALKTLLAVRLIALSIIIRLS